MGFAEIGVVLVVALIVFGPEKLPDIAKQAGGFVRTLRQMAQNAKDDLGREMGQDFSDLNLRDLDPREIVRKNFLENDTTPSPTREQRILRPGETPPYDPEST